MKPNNTYHFLLKKPGFEPWIVKILFRYLDAQSCTPETLIPYKFSALSRSSCSVLVDYNSTKFSDCAAKYNQYKMLYFTVVLLAIYSTVDL